MQPGPTQLRAWMARRDVNLAEAADLLGFHQTFLSKILNGHRTPGLTNAIHIEDVTGVSTRSWLTDRASELDETVGAGPANRRKAR